VGGGGGGAGWVLVDWEIGRLVGSEWGDYRNEKAPVEVTGAFC